jgi:hypothetical protein
MLHYLYFMINTKTNETMTTTFKFNTTEANGTYDFGSYSTSERLTNEEAVGKYLELRVNQSQKGFKRPMPKEVSISL